MCWNGPILTPCSISFGSRIQRGHTTIKEFRSLHVWHHPALKNYDWMLWLDGDGFCTETWKVDPIAYAIRHNLVILFDNFPQGSQHGDDWQERMETSFGHSVCGYDLIDGHLTSSKNCPDGSKIKGWFTFWHKAHHDVIHSSMR